MWTREVQPAVHCIAKSNSKASLKVVDGCLLNRKKEDLFIPEQHFSHCYFRRNILPDFLHQDHFFGHRFLCRPPWF